nr:MAG TPA: Sporulation protein YpjB (SpoYpjB) [Caudoviricetes sp.]
MVTVDEETKQLLRDVVALLSLLLSYLGWRSTKEKRSKKLGRKKHRKRKR